MVVECCGGGYGGCVGLVARGKETSGFSVTLYITTFCAKRIPNKQTKRALGVVGVMNLIMKHLVSLLHPNVVDQSFAID